MLLNEYPVVAGHFSFAQIPASLFDTTFFFTFLRDPIDRALSHYYYYRNQSPRENADRRVALAQTRDLADLVDELPNRPSPWSNWQTYVFSGARHGEQPADELLRAAISNLERMDFVGIHEEFDDGLWHLGQLQEWLLARVAQRVNVTAGRAPHDGIDARTLKRLRDLNVCDAALYARAREIWQETKAGVRRMAPHPTFPRELAAERNARAEYGTREIVITDVQFRPDAAAPGPGKPVAPTAIIDVRGISHVATGDVTVGIRLTDALGVELYGVNTLALGLHVALQEEQPFDVTFVLDMALAPGRYYLTVAVHAADDHLHKCYHWIDNALTIEWDAPAPRVFSGLVNLRARAMLSLSPPAASPSGL